MTDTALAALFITPPLAMLAATLIPARFERHLPRLVVLLAGLNALAAISLAVGFGLTSGRPLLSQWNLPGIELGWSVDYDGPASLMLGLVGFIGWIIAHYSVRYLDGESAKGRYFRWLSFTIGSVSMLVTAGNLLMFWAWWIVTSLGLHQLLMHYGHRPLARRAAWTKFAVSRLGDGLLLVSLTLLYREFGTLEFDTLNAMAATASSPGISIAILLLVCGAAVKTAQFPFHTWLPLTIETPTPVSALMHAGIVNAGGYLMIRSSGLLMATPTAMAVLVVIGALTAAYGAIVMRTQTSIKNALAYSTIAQMGFMMLQCGLGAFSAAMLHILAHSLYKAYSFLSSGSVMSRRATLLVPNGPSGTLAWAPWIASVIGLAGCLGVAGSLMLVDFSQKPGGIILGSIVVVALGTWLAEAMRQGDSVLMIRSLLVASLLCIVYVASFAIVNAWIAASVPDNAGWMTPWVTGTVVAGMLVGMVAFQLARDRQSLSSRWSSLQIHASNGFYIDHCFRRLFGTIS